MDRDEIALLLPEVFRRTLKHKGSDNVLWALLGVMERLQERDVLILDNLERFFDPTVLPKESAAAFLPFLARWVDLDWVLPERGEYEAGLVCLRNLILAAPDLAATRGTRKGLETFLETATGLPGYRVVEDPDLPFLITIHCPTGAEKFGSLVERIARGEKPAYTIFDLVFVKQPAPQN